MTSFSFFFDIFVCFTGKRNYYVQRRDTGHADQTHRAVQEDGGQYQWSVFQFCTRGNLDKGLPLLWDGVPQIIYNLYGYSLQIWALRCSPVGLLFTSEEQKKKAGLFNMRCCTSHLGYGCHWYGVLGTWLCFDEHMLVVNKKYVFFVLFCFIPVDRACGADSLPLSFNSFVDTCGILWTMPFPPPPLVPL